MTSTAPGTSSRTRTGSGPGGSSRGAAATASAETTAGTTNVHRHDTQVDTAPDISIPEVAPNPASPPHTASALACRASSG
ncbi:hypothetical protein GCM10020000_41690 [Streptomyces olivoverticillatus]